MTGVGICCGGDFCGGSGSLSEDELDEEELDEDEDSPAASVERSALRIGCWAPDDVSGTLCAEDED